MTYLQLSPMLVLHLLGCSAARSGLVCQQSVYREREDMGCVNSLHQAWTEAVSARKLEQHEGYCYFYQP